MTAEDEIHSCTSCAWRLSNLDRDTAAGYTGTSTPQVDVCAKFGQVLGGLPGTGTEIAEADAQKIGTRCAAHTTLDRKADVRAELEASKEATPGALGERGSLLRLTLPLEVPVDRGDASTPANCGRCTYFCWPEEFEYNGLPTVSKQGRGAGMCVAYGTIQDAGAGARKVVASRCPTYTPTPDARTERCAEYRTELLSMATHKPHLLPLLSDSVVGTGVEVAEEAEKITQQAAAERQVTDAERTAGITAFRRFHSDDKTRWVDLPVFDPEHFDETERAKIPVAGSEGAPEAYVDHANLAYRVAVAWALGETPALNGPAGTGKTMLFHWLAYELGLPFERISITASSSVDDLAGYMELHGSSTEFVLGRVPKAWAKPCIMVIDEPNAGPPEVWQFIRPITDSAKQLVIDANHGQTVDRNPYSYLGMAMNPAWDWRNSGVSPLADADGSRLLHIAVGYPSVDDERAIILGHCAGDGVEVAERELDALLAVATELRKLSRDHTLQVSWGVRQQVQVARLLPYFDFVDAFRMAVTDSLEPEQADLILTQVNLATAAWGKGKKKWTK